MLETDKVESLAGKNFETTGPTEMGDPTLYWPNLGPHNTCDSSLCVCVCVCVRERERERERENLSSLFGTFLASTKT